MTPDHPSSEPTNDKSIGAPFCSFCGKSHLLVGQLIEGNSARICGGCIRECGQFDETDLTTASRRAEMTALIKRREKQIKADIPDRFADLLVEYDSLCAKNYKWTDEAWRQATAAAQRALDDARKVVADRFSKLGIPPRFAPRLTKTDQSNMGADRLAMMRGVALERIKASQVAAIEAVGRLSLEAQTHVSLRASVTQEVRDFLEKMPDLDRYMPRLDPADVEASLI